MKKQTLILLVGLLLLAAGTVAQAHSSGPIVRGSVSIGVPIGHHGYAVFGAGLPLYPYGHSGCRHMHRHSHYDPRRYDYRYGYRYDHRGKSRHHRGHHDHGRRGRHGHRH